MNEPADIKPRANLADYLAAERTFLAWIRTGLALMGFGFVVARFGLFLQQIQFTEHQPAAPTYGLSLWFGTALIVVGVIVNLFSAWHHSRMIRELDRGQAARSSPMIQTILLALFLALFGLALAIYLVTVRSSAISHSANGEETIMAGMGGNGIIHRPSNHGLDQAVEKLQTILRSKGVTLFALVDHSGEAEKGGLKMPPTKLLIFGNPQAGTPLMLASPTSAIDLPLKILVSQDAQGKVWISYNSPAYLQERHHLPADLLPNIAVVETLAAKAGE
jgi:uncharacterized protein (DUF302 family)/uncharacterized membrane protein YidH (DUF202 family)